MQCNKNVATDDTTDKQGTNSSISLYHQEFTYNNCYSSLMSDNSITIMNTEQ